MPAADVRRDIANLLLTGIPDLFHVMPYERIGGFLDRPSLGNDFQNIANLVLRIGAEVGSGAQLRRQNARSQRE